MLSSNYKSVGVLLATIVGLAGATAVFAAGHGGGGGGGGGGGFHGGGGSFGGGGFHGGSYGGGGMSAAHFSGASYGSFSAPHMSGGSTFAGSRNFSGSSHVSSFNSTGTMHNSTFTGANHFHNGVNPGHFTAGTSNHPVNPQSWQHNANWWHSNANWNHGYPWYGYHHFYPNYWYPFAWGSLWYPFWWSIGPFYGGWGYGWGSYPYCEYYYGADSGYQPTAYVSTADYPPSEPAVNGNAPTPAPAEEPSAPPASGGETDWGVQYLGGARDAFQQGSYADALRLAKHASIEMPQNPKPHELMALAAFALKDYRGANLEAVRRLADVIRLLWESADVQQANRRFGGLRARAQGRRRCTVRAGVP